LVADGYGRCRWVYLLITTQRGSIKNNEQRIRLYRMVEFIGRWSMVDVFVDTFTAAQGEGFEALPWRSRRKPTESLSRGCQE
jgi:hypothetical protein